MDPRLASLKTHLHAATDFGPLFAEFLDLVESPGFLDRGRRVHAPALEAALQAVAGAPPDPLVTVRLDDEGFVHGSFLIGRRVGTVFAFDDPGKGLAALTGAQGETLLYRFSVELAPQAPPPR